MKTTVAIADDHSLLAKAYADVVSKFGHYEVIIVVKNGRDLIEQIQRTNQIPDIVMLDYNMPEMDGFETAAQLRQLYPTVRVLALLMDDRQEYIDRMISNGARGYLMKDCGLNELRQALDDIRTKGYY